MSRLYVVLAGVAVGMTFTLGVWFMGYAARGREEELKDAKADQEQLDERRESQNAVNRLDDTGLRDAIGVREDK